MSFFPWLTNACLWSSSFQVSQGRTGPEDSLPAGEEGGVRPHGCPGAAPSPAPFSRYSSSPRRRASSCCSDRENGHFPGSRGKVKLANSRFRFWCRMANSRYRLEQSWRPAM